MARARRFYPALATAVVASALLSACGNAGESAEESDGADEVQLRFTWWGGDSRNEYTREIIDAFEAEYPHISISPEHADWGGYWDRLATQAAGRDLPDVIQMELRYMREYISSEQFIPLDDVNVDDISPAVLDGGLIDGEQYGIPSGSTVPSMVANREVFEEAGVEFPDDQTWTWEDFREIAQEVSDNSDAAGLARPLGDFGFEVWLRQHAGTDIVTEDGALGYTAEDSVPYFEMLEDMTDSGAMASASAASEDRGAALEQTLVVSGEAAMYVEWDTTIMQLSGGENENLEPLRFPTTTGSGADSEQFFKPAMFYSASASSDHPEEVQLFIEYLVNNEEAGRLTGIDRGLPGNERVREAIVPDLAEGAEVIVEYQEELEPDISAIPPVPPEGYGAVQDIIFRYEEEIIFDRMTPEEAAESMASEIESAIS